MENVMYCKNCGMKLENGAKFCGRCGMPVDNEIFEHIQDDEYCRQDFAKKKSLD